MPAAPALPGVDRHRFARRRAAVLIGVHLLIGLHLAHWKIAGRTLAPLELNEVMHTLELGLVTAGFLLMATAVLSVLVVGRFFCSWGCHLLALQDLCAWLLRRAGIHPVPVRSRLLRLVPLGAAVYMFVWPQVARLLVRSWPSLTPLVGPRPDFRLRVATEAEGWASFVTSDFARNLPGPGMALLTFLVCGFVVVWLLGTRSFCRDVCPYGALFSAADRFAPGRIVLAGDCTGCALCTAVCETGLRVHEEVARHGQVTSGDCLKDLDCVAVCPTGGLAFGFRRPPLLARRGVARPYDTSRGEELLAAAVFLVVLLATRGLYRLVPFLLALTLAGLAAFAAVVALRLARRPEVRWQRWRLRRAGRLTTAGAAFVGLLLLAGGATAHAARLRWHEWRGDRAWNAWQLQSGDGPLARAAARRALHHAEARTRFALWRPADLDPRRVALHRALGNDAAAIALLGELAPRDPRAALDLAELLARRGQLAEAETALRALVGRAPETAAAHYGLGVVLAAQGRRLEAVAALRAAHRLTPDDPEVLNNLGWELAAEADPRRRAEAEAHLRRARALSPGWPLPCLNLAAVLEAAGRPDEAAATRAGCPAGG